ncbi:hypothetical protein UA32_16355 [Photobacterium angustum]|uniref:Uncharacterized protein n=1 Tax=Photobacterium angustum TaxID=661 RepID=A0ABX5H9V0_PHOAN|nr:hypothetical protein [Photobacterium angustum]KJG36573.1 hypothetical protein UA32_16355 [Photobacterium angustum]PSX12387.1 hypothetical protein C0W27_04150 [Photobacterium angustum]
MSNLKIFFYIISIIISSNVIAKSSTKQTIDFPLNNGDKAIYLSFRGEIYTHEIAELIHITSTNTINAFIAKVIDANINKEPSKILALWDPSERDTMSVAINKPSALARNASLYKNIQNSKLLGYVEYGDYVICYIEYLINGMPEPYMKLYPLKIKGDLIFQTNKLSSDIFFSKFSYELGKYIWYK